VRRVFSNTWVVYPARPAGRCLDPLTASYAGETRWPPPSSATDLCKSGYPRAVSRVSSPACRVACPLLCRFDTGERQREREQERESKRERILWEQAKATRLAAHWCAASLKSRRPDARRLCLSTPFIMKAPVPGNHKVHDLALTPRNHLVHVLGLSANKKASSSARPWFHERPPGGGGDYSSCWGPVEMEAMGKARIGCRNEWKWEDAKRGNKVAGERNEAERKRGTSEPQRPRAYECVRIVCASSRDSACAREGGHFYVYTRSLLCVQ